MFRSNIYDLTLLIKEDKQLHTNNLGDYETLKSQPQLDNHLNIWGIIVIIRG